MSEQGGFFSRVSRWVKRQFSPQEELPLMYGQTPGANASLSRRPMFGLPWNRRDEDLSGLQAGLTSMTALMSSLRQYLDQQGARHDELLTYLSQLSQALQAIPDSSRTQSEMLRVLHQQIAYQNAQHKQLSEMLRKISDSVGGQQDVFELVRDRLETLYKNDQQISDTVEGMGNSMAVVTQNSQTNTLVLERLRDNLVTRDSDLERYIRQQNRWIIGGLMVAIALSGLSLLIALIVLPYNVSAISHIAAEVSQSQPRPTPASGVSVSETTSAPEAGRTPQMIVAPATQETHGAAPIDVPATQGSEAVH